VPRRQTSQKNLGEIIFAGTRQETHPHTPKFGLRSRIRNQSAGQLDRESSAAQPSATLEWRPALTTRIPPTPPLRLLLRARKGSNFLRTKLTRNLLFGRSCHQPSD
jgi:hypothetical protein